MISKSENAVSEVVGVMLMLSVTIILVAVVAVIVSSSSVTDNRAITADIRATGVSDGNITMELIGGDSFSLAEIKIVLGVRENSSKTVTLSGYDVVSYSGSSAVAIGDRFKIVGVRDGAGIEFGEMKVLFGEHLTYRVYDHNGNAVSAGEIGVR